MDKVRGLPAGHGLNAATGEYVDLLAAGINDPVKVTRSALQNAASIAGLFLTTEAVVADKPEKNAPAMGGGDEWAAWAAWAVSNPRCPASALNAVQRRRSHLRVGPPSPVKRWSLPRRAPMGVGGSGRIVQ